MTPSRTTFDGRTLVLPSWKFSRRDAAVPHRRRVIASHNSNQVDYFVCCNHKRKLFWVHAVGDGFAGTKSRASNCVSTRNLELANQWIEAVQTGFVKLSEE